MYEVIYLNKTLNKRITATFWSQESADKFVNEVNKNEDLVLLAVYNNYYLYD